ncbi:phosphate metabolism protein 7 [Coemansia sp. RSA 2673]|nr:phosphate metabolism protein 7 [Coemansia sp. RSA 2673]
MFMHSLRSGMQVFLTFAAIALPTLLAVDIDNRGESQSLDRLTMSNIEDYDGRVWAHVAMFAAFSGKSFGVAEKVSASRQFTPLYMYANRIQYVLETVVIALYVTLGDIWYYIGIRQRHLQDSDYQKELRANTVIVTGIPSSQSMDQILQDMFGSLPGGIAKISPCLSSPTIRQLVEMRKWHVSALESDVCRYLVRLYRRCKRDNWQAVERPLAYLRLPTRLSILSHIGIFRGEKVDSIAYHCREIVQLNNDICTLRASMPEAAETSTSAIVVFNSQQSAHEAARPTVSAKWYKRAVTTACWPRFSDIDPTEVTQLSQLGPFKDISEWPTPLSGLIQGVFPPLILALLQWAVPSLFRGKYTTLAWHINFFKNGLLVAKPRVSNVALEMLGFEV